MADGAHGRYHPDVDLAAQREEGTLLVFPVLGSDDEALGVLQLWTRAPGAFDQDEIALLRKLVGVVANTWQADAVEGVRESLRVAQDAREAVALSQPSIHELAATLLQSTSLHELSSRLSVTARTLVGSMHTTLFMHDAASGEVWIPGPGAAAQRYRLAACFLKWLLGRVPRHPANVLFFP